MGVVRSAIYVVGLHGLVAEDITKAHQRPKMERYGRTLFTTP